MIELAGAAMTLIGTLAPLVAKAINAREEDHASILAEAQLAGAEFLGVIDGLVVQLLTNDRKADDALLAKFDTSDAKK